MWIQGVGLEVIKDMSSKSIHRLESTFRADPEVTKQADPAYD